MAVSLTTNDAEYVFDGHMKFSADGQRSHKVSRHLDC